MSKKPIVLIHINGKDGKVEDLPVFANDDPSQLAKQFLDNHGLPQQLHSVIVQKIVDSVLEASRKKVARANPSEVVSPISRLDRRSINTGSNEEEAYNRLKSSFWTMDDSNIHDKSASRLELLTLSPSRSLSIRSAPSPRRPVSARQQREAMTQLHNTAARYDRHKEDLRRKLELTADESIIQKDFRFQLSQSPTRWKAHQSLVSHVPRGGDPFERLYKDFLDKEQRAKSKQEEAERIQLAKDQEACSAIPKMETKAKMQLPASQSASAVFEGLYEWSHSQRLRKELARSEMLKATSPSFSPRICKHSVKLAEQRLQRSRSRSPLFKAVSQEQIMSPSETYMPPLGTRAVTPTLEFKPLPESHDATGVGASRHVESLSKRHRTASSASDSHGQAPTVAEGSTNAAGTGAKADLDENAIRTLREAGAALSSNASASITAPLYSPYSHRILRVEIPDPVRDPSPDFATAVSPLSDNSNMYLPMRGPDSKVEHHFAIPTIVDVTTNDFSCPDVFERLYQAKDERSQAHQELVRRYQSPGSHIPAVSPASRRRSVEKTPDEFFQRLYDQRQHRQQAELERKIERDRALVEQSRKTAITPDRREKLVERLLQRHQHTEEEVQKSLEDMQEERRRQSNQSYVLKRSGEMVRRRQTESLNEIFDVLLVTVQYHRDLTATRPSSGAQLEQTDDSSEEGAREASLERKATAPSPSLDLSDADNPPHATVENSDASLSPGLRESEMGESEEKATHAKVRPAKSIVLLPSAEPRREEAPCEEDADRLDTMLADCSLLKPYLLHTTIQTVMDAMKPARISRQQFVQAVLALMNTRRFAPLNNLLVQPDKRFERKYRNRSYLSAYDAQATECTHQPSLLAGKTSTSLVKDRYKDRYSGTERVEDSLYSYAKHYKDHLEELRKERDEQERKECTFCPQSFSRYMKDARESVQRIRRNNELASHSGTEHSLSTCTSVLQSTPQNHPPGRVEYVPIPRTLGWRNQSATSANITPT